jgi:hypothetical protein
MGVGDDMMKYDGIKHLGYDKIWPKKSFMNFMMKNFWYLGNPRSEWNF